MKQKKSNLNGSNNLILFAAGAILLSVCITSLQSDDDTVEAIIVKPTIEPTINRTIEPPTEPYIEAAIDPVIEPTVTIVEVPAKITPVMRSEFRAEMSAEMQSEMREALRREIRLERIATEMPTDMPSEKRIMSLITEQLNRTAKYAEDEISNITIKSCRANTVDVEYMIPEGHDLTTIVVPREVMECVITYHKKSTDEEHNGEYAYDKDQHSNFRLVQPLYGDREYWIAIPIPNYY